MPNPPQIVRGPVAVPPTDGIRAARGLGVVENPSDDLDPSRQWGRGYTFDFDRCNAGYLTNPCSNTARPTVRGNGGRRRVEPFVVTVGRVCGTFGWQAQDYAADANRLLDAYQWKLIAAELWTGTFAQAEGWTNPDPDDGVGNPFLAWHLDPQFLDLVADHGGDPLVDAFGPVDALSVLEQGLAECSGSSNGVIHATKRMATIWASLDLLEREGGRLFTRIGTQIIADNGYDGSGPTMDPPDPEDPIVPGTPATLQREWAYATGPIQLRIEPTLRQIPSDMSEALDRSNNDVTYYAERKASVAWGCCHLAAAINPYSDNDSGGGSGGGDAGTYGGNDGGGPFPDDGSS